MKITLVEKDHLPYGVKCTLCNRIMRQGQWALWKTIPDVTHIVFHTKCMENKLEEIPTDLDENLEAVYTGIQNDYIEGKVFNE